MAHSPWRPLLCASVIIGLFFLGLLLRQDAFLKVGGRYYWSGQQHPLTFSGSLQRSGQKPLLLHVIGTVATGPVPVILWQVEADDCADFFAVNGHALKPFCGKTILRLGTYLHRGTNVFSATIRDKGGITGLTIKPYKYDLWRALPGLVAILGVLILGLWRFV